MRSPTLRRCRHKLTITRGWRDAAGVFCCVFISDAIAWSWRCRRRDPSCNSLISVIHIPGLLANVLIFASYHKDTYDCALKHDPVRCDPTDNQQKNVVSWINVSVLSLNYKLNPKIQPLLAARKLSCYHSAFSGEAGSDTWPSCVCIGSYGSSRMFTKIEAVTTWNHLFCYCQPNPCNVLFLTKGHVTLHS